MVSYLNNLGTLNGKPQNGGGNSEIERLRETDKQGEKKEMYVLNALFLSSLGL